MGSYNTTSYIRHTHKNLDHLQFDGHLPAKSVLASFILFLYKIFGDKLSGPFLLL